jgi:hypothetical protein
MKQFLQWAAGILEDQSGSASSKRVGFFWAYALLSYMVIASVNGRTISMEIFYGILGLVLTGYGLITSEFFRKSGVQNQKESD